MEEIARLLSSFPTFDQLPPEEIERIAGEIQIEYFPANTDILVHGGQPAEFLYIICRGSVNLLREPEDGQTQIYDTLGVGEVFGHPSLIRGQPPMVTARAHTEALIYLLPGKLFHQLRARYPDLGRAFAATMVERIGHAAHTRHSEAAPALFQTRLRDLVRRKLVAISPDTPVREAAQRMREAGVSSLLVDLPPYGTLDSGSGIITDRDLRNRVVAQGLPFETPVREVMTAPVNTLPSDSLVFEGLLLMLEHGFHHLPVTENGLVSGLITHTDILRQQSQSPLFLPKLLERARNLSDLRHYTEQVVHTVGALLDAGARVSDIGRVVAVAHDALLVHLLKAAEAELGPPPCPYAWMVLGSEGRLEQTLRTDQDNALIYADDAPSDAEAYFATLAKYVVDDLVACGFPRCPGDIMATNPRWRRSLREWKEYFHHWINVPDEENLLRVGIFFDFRQVHGTLKAEEALRPVLLEARRQQIFLARLARTALRQSAPLTIFRQVALERRGDLDHVIDLKQRGTAMVVDIARVYALESGTSEANTIKRLQNAWGQSSISQVGAESLIAAFELISLLRLRHQYGQITSGQEPTNYVVFPELSPLEQRELKESMQAIARIQRNAELHFRVDLLG
jgi:CBS domain-containing protein